jgi:hypothetical protein
LAAAGFSPKQWGHFVVSTAMNSSCETNRYKRVIKEPETMAPFARNRTRISFLLKQFIKTLPAAATKTGRQDVSPEDQQGR